MSDVAFDYYSEKTKHKIHLSLSAFKKPKNSKDYKKLEKLLDQLIDEVRGDEHHPLAVAMEIIGNNLEEFDDKYSPPIGENVSDVQVVQYLMKEYQLSQKDLASVFGGQGNVSKFLNGQRDLSKHNIVGLKEKFHVSPALFFK